MCLSQFWFKNKNMNDVNVLFEAIQSGEKDRVEVLLMLHPNLVNEKDNIGFTPLIYATYFDKEAIAKCLIKYKALIDDKDATGNTALIGVCFKGNVDLARYLVEQGANVNAFNNNGTTPLIFSALYNKVDCVKLLLKHNADDSIKDIAGKKAYDYASEKGFDEIAQLLLENK